MVYNPTMSVENIRQTLESCFSPTVLKLTDQSHRHAGHPETMRGPEMLLDLVIVSKEFEGKTLLEKHAAVHAALKLGNNAEIHGITIRAYSLSEWEKNT